MKKEGKFVELSSEASERIDDAIAQEFMKVKKESEIKQRNSWKKVKGIIISLLSS